MKNIMKCTAALFLIISTNSFAATAASGLIIDGTTFGTSNAFRFTNDSTSGETITKLRWDLTPINGFFDTTNTAPGNSSSPLTLSGSSDPVGQIFPSNASVNGSSILDIDFTDFNVGETFIFGVDTDLFSAIDSFGIDGVGFIGAIATAWFSDGTITHGFYTATTQAGFGSEVSITSPGVPQVPIPAAAFLFGPALLGFLGFRRKSKTA